MPVPRGDWPTNCSWYEYESPGELATPIVAWLKGGTGAQHGISECVLDRGFGRLERVFLVLAVADHAQFHGRSEDA